MPFCSKCGTEVLENVSFCSKCGNAISGTATNSSTKPPSTEGPYYKPSGKYSPSFWGYFSLSLVVIVSLTLIFDNIPYVSDLGFRKKMQVIAFILDLCTYITFFFAFMGIMSFVVKLGKVTNLYLTFYEPSQPSSGEPYYLTMHKMKLLYVNSDGAISEILKGTLRWIKDAKEKLKQSSVYLAIDKQSVMEIIQAKEILFSHQTAR